MGSVPYPFESQATWSGLKNSLRRVVKRLVGGGGSQRQVDMVPRNQDICKTQNTGPFIFHDLRDCAVTSLADARLDIETIMKIVGHCSVEMFLRSRRRSSIMR